jgi:hypothetical protein
MKIRNFKETEMIKNTKTLSTALTVALAVALSSSAMWGQAVCPGAANATICTIDNFTGGYGLVKPITSGSEEVNQPATGTGAGIVGGTRSINLGVAINQFGQPTQAQTVRKSSTNPTPALVWSNGYGNYSGLQVVYGEGVAPLDLDLTQYNTDSNGRIRFTFAGLQQELNFNVEVDNPGLYFGCAINIDPSNTSFTVDFPFDQFTGNPTGAPDWGDITAILFEFEGGYAGAPQLAVTDIEVIAATSSTPPATWSCQAPTE